MISINDLKINGQKNGDTFDIKVTATLNDSDSTEVIATISTKMDYVSSKRTKLVGRLVNLALDDILDKVKTLEKAEEVNNVELEVKQHVNQFKQD